jgi:hypothetical protein
MENNIQYVIHACTQFNAIIICIKMKINKEYNSALMGSNYPISFIIYQKLSMSVYSISCPRII